MVKYRTYNTGRIKLPGRIIFTVLAIILSGPITAQDIRPLSIGDQVPDIEFSLVNSQVSSTNLSYFTGKLVILDFWATWCGGCIGKFPEMESLQKKFNGHLKIILVNSKEGRDTENGIIEFFKKWKTRTGTAYTLASAINDTIASGYFPNRSLPHYVWITTDGKVKAITSAEEVTEKNIEKVLRGEMVLLPPKKDFFGSKPLYLGEDIIMDDITQYSLFKKGKIEGLNTVSDLRISQKDGNYVVRGRAWRNIPLLDMYKVVMYKLMSENKVNDKRMILEITDSSKLFFDEKKSTKEIWEKDNLYTCDLLVPAAQSASLYNSMLELLNRYSGYEGKIEKKKIDCLVLVRTDTLAKISSTGGYPGYPGYSLQDSKQGYLKNLPISEFVTGLNRLKWIKLLVLDETNYTSNADMEFLPADMHDLSTLRSALRRYGLDLQETQREVNMFVLHEQGDQYNRKN